MLAFKEIKLREKIGKLNELYIETRILNGDIYDAETGEFEDDE